MTSQPSTPQGDSAPTDSRLAFEDEAPLKFDRDGLVTVVAQDHLSGEVRMVAHANREAIARTLATGRATFFSRSRQELWEKGKTSGNGLVVRGVSVDCDADCLIYSVEAEGPSCHTGARTCFFRPVTADGSATDNAAFGTQTLLARLESELEARKTSTTKASYTKSLYEGGAPAINAKIVEEASELAEAIERESGERVASEAADLIYHLVVGLRFRSVSLSEVFADLDRRMGTSGHVEKAQRSPKP